MEQIKLKAVPDEMQKRIIRMMTRTWEVIGYVVLECVERNSIPRSEVIECVCDAGYCSTHGGDQDAYKVFDKLSYDDMKKLGRIAFPYTRYGR